MGSTTSGSRLRSVADIVVTLTMGVAAVALLWRILGDADANPRQGRESEAVEDLTKSGLSTTVAMEVKGRPDAPIVMVEFADFECPFCGRYARETFEQLDREFISVGKVQYAFRNLPLPIHRLAAPAAAAAECAAHQGKFWEMHGFLFANQADLAKAVWRTPSPGLGIDTAALDECMASSTQTRVTADLAEASRLGIRSTPTFLVGTRAKDGSVKVVSRINGARPYQVFREVLDRIQRG